MPLSWEPIKEVLAGPSDGCREGRNVPHFLFSKRLTFWKIVELYLNVYVFHFMEGFQAGIWKEILLCPLVTVGPRWAHNKAKPCPRTTQG